MKGPYPYRYLILRRFVQLSILFLFLGSNLYGWQILKGNYSSGLILGTINLSDPYAGLQILATGFIAGADVLVGALTVLLLYGLVFGRMFCSWICPVNIITDTAIYGSKKLKLKNTLFFNRKTRYAILILSLILSAILATPAFEIISPVSMFHRAVIFGTGGAWAVVLALFLFDFGLVRYGWCGHLCPIGAFYSLIGKYSLLKVRHDADQCTNCGKCFKVCHEEQVLTIINKETGFIKSGECSSCLRCVEVCDDRALKLAARISFKKNKTE